jgi:hypothetical protein
VAAAASALDAALVPTHAAVRASVSVRPSRILRSRSADRRVVEDRWSRRPATLRDRKILRQCRIHRRGRLLSAADDEHRRDQQAGYAAGVVHDGSDW